MRNIKITDDQSQSFNMQCTNDEYNNLMDVGFDATLANNCEFRAKVYDTIQSRSAMSCEYEDGVVEYCGTFESAH